MSIERNPNSIGPVIAIDGPGGAGKSTLARELAQEFGVDPSSQIIHGDDFFEPWPADHPERIPDTPGWFNHIRFMSEVGDAVNLGIQIERNRYDWQSHRLVREQSPDMQQPVIVEGVKILGLPIHWDQQIWVEVPREVRQQRFMDRRVEDRRAGITDYDTLLDAFNRWADDMVEYEHAIALAEREDILTVSGLISASEQIALITNTIADQ